MDSSCSQDLTLQTALNAVCIALKDQYIQELTAVQTKLKMLQYFEQVETLPSSFAMTWKNIQRESASQTEAAARLTVEIQNFLTPGRHSHFH